MPHPQSAPAPMTIAQWAALDEEHPGELVDGLLVEEELPSLVHEVLVGALIEQFRSWTQRRALVVGSESKLAVTPI